MSYTRARRIRAFTSIVRMRRERIDEEEQDVDLAFRDHRADLLVAAQGAALQAREREGHLSITRPPVVPVAKSAKGRRASSCMATKRAMSSFLASCATSANVSWVMIGLVSCSSDPATAFRRTGSCCAGRPECA